MTKHHWEVLNSGNINVANSPEELWIAACNYFRWCDANPIESGGKLKSGPKAGDDIIEKRARAYHLKGLCLHCGIEEEYLRDIRQTKDKGSDYYIVVSRILYIIYSQNFELAAVNELNSIFISKALGMEKEEVSNTPVRVEVFQSANLELSNSENEILEKLESEIGNL